MNDPTLPIDNLLKFRNNLRNDYWWENLINLNYINYNLTKDDINREDDVKIKSGVKAEDVESIVVIIAKIWLMINSRMY